MCPKGFCGIFPEWKGVVKPYPSERGREADSGESARGTSYEGEILVANPVVKQGGRHIDPISGEQVGRIIEDGCAVVMFKRRALSMSDVLTLIDELQELVGMMTL